MDSSLLVEIIVKKRSYKGSNLDLITKSLTPRLRRSTVSIKLKLFHACPKIRAAVSWISLKEVTFWTQYSQRFNDDKLLILNKSNQLFKDFKLGLMKPTVFKCFKTGGERYSVCFAHSIV